eukprot:scaffold49_cov409-Prasinococcus_capsulatus_cf.AAC.37
MKAGMMPISYVPYRKASTPGPGAFLVVCVQIRKGSRALGICRCSPNSSGDRHLQNHNGLSWGTRGLPRVVQQRVHPLQIHTPGDLAVAEAV